LNEIVLLVHFQNSVDAVRDGFRNRVALDYVRFGGPTQVSDLSVCLKRVKTCPSYV